MTDSPLIRRLFGTAALLSLASPLQAQTPDLAVPDEAQEETNGEPPIIVTAARTQLPASALPLTVDIIGPEDLDEQLAIGGSIVDAVSALSPSFSPTRQKLTGAGESLRGRSPLYAINGIPQSTPVRDGSRDGFTIDPFFIDRVELIYGSNALQGIGATGGVVNQVIVSPPREDGLSGRAMLQASADDDLTGDGFGWKAAGLGSWRGGAIDVTAGAAYERRGVFFDGEDRIIGPDGAQGEIQDSDSWSAFGRIGLRVGDSGRLELIANRFELEGDNEYVAVPGNPAIGLPTTGVPGATPGLAPSNRVETVSLSFTDDELAGGNLVAQFFYNRTRDIFGGGTFGTFQDPSIAPVGSLFDQSANRSRKLGSRFSYERAILDDLTATVGFDTLFDRTEQSLVLTGRSWVPEVDFRSLAPFAQLNWALFDDVLRLAGGARWENVRTRIADFQTLAVYGSQMVEGGNPSFDDLLLNGGVIVEPLPGIRAYASYAEGYTLADIGRILRGIDTPGVDVDNFLDLTPVISNNREIGVEVDRGPLTASATYFWSSSDLGSRLELIGGAYV
ncbi:MAG: TonB-dependent receptor, partial [Sphingomonadales bacterium]|nr:TonB-dependent receptor [Sphingomonadales bacterium]